jgi:hypothetical protein
MDQIIFKRDKICERFGISKNFFYKLTKLQMSPIKLIEGTWACSVEQMIDFIKNYKMEEK